MKGLRWHLGQELMVTSAGPRFSGTEGKSPSTCDSTSGPLSSCFAVGRTQGSRQPGGLCSGWGRSTEALQPVMDEMGMWARGDPGTGTVEDGLHYVQ